MFLNQCIFTFLTIHIHDGNKKGQEKHDPYYNSPPGLFPFPPLMGTKTIGILNSTNNFDMYQ